MTCNKEIHKDTVRCMAALSYYSQEMETLFSLKAHLDVFLQRLFPSVNYVTHQVSEEAKESSVPQGQ